MYSQNPYNITILPFDQHMVLELDQTTTVRELLVVINEYLNLQGNIEIWTFFSSKRQIFLKIDDLIGYQQNENFVIDTQPVQAQQSQQGQNIILTINIKDGSINYNMSTTFNSKDTLEDVAEAIRQYCGISAQVGVVDLFYLGQPINNRIVREKTLSQLEIKINTNIQAKIRWIGG